MHQSVVQSPESGDGEVMIDRRTWRAPDKGTGVSVRASSVAYTRIGVISPCALISVNIFSMTVSIVVGCLFVSAGLRICRIVVCSILHV